MPKVLLVAWERFSEIKHAFTDKQYQPEDIHELMHKLLEDVRNISEELADECDMLVCDDFMTFSNPLFDSNDYFTSSDDESLSNEDIPKENFKMYSNPLFDDEEIISTKIDPHSFNAESNLIESLLNRDTLIDSSPKFDYLLEEFSGELDHIDPIPPRIKEADFDLEEEICLVENLSYDNSSPQPPKEHNSENVDMIIESPSPISYPIADGIPFSRKKCLSNDPFPLPKNESSNLDHFNDPSSSRPPPKTRMLSFALILSPIQIFDPGIFIEVQSERLLSRDEFSISFIRDSLSPVFDTLLPFSFENKDKVFNPGILTSHLLSHRDKITSDFSESPMMISGGNIPLLDVPFLHFYPP
ncbi:hypothetical protein Tco_0865203 [Tanacetum coccineum]